MKDLNKLRFEAACFQITTLNSSSILYCLLGAERILARIRSKIVYAMF